jgi:hypothetical protein
VFAVMAWTVMKWFGGIKVEDELNGSQIHQLENIITMDSNIHKSFDNLQLWLEAVVHFSLLPVFYANTNPG